MTKGNRAVLLGASALALSLAAGAAMAGPQDNSLNIAWELEVPNISMYHNTDRIGIIIAHHVWDSLIYRNPDSGEFEPLLAESWELVDDVTIDVVIRDDVLFHNGEPMTVEDVVFTFNYIANPNSDMLSQQTVNWIEKAEALDDRTVRITAKRPTPLALLYMAGDIGIYPKDYYQEVGPDGMGRAPIGTGPYKVTEVVPGTRMVFERFEDYYEGSPKGMPSIERIVQRTIPELNTQVVELASGRLDWMWRVPADQVDRLNAMPTINVLNASTMRIGYLQFDAVGKSGDNPFTDRRVRQAVNHAIDRDAIVDNLVRGDSVVINAACHPAQFGCIDDVTTYEYDPERARELLAEAGYPDGFQTRLYGYRDRPYTEAMIGNLNDVGITTDLRWGQYAATRDAIRGGDVPLAFMTWGSNSVPDVDNATPVFFGGLADDLAMDEEVIAWLEAGGSTLDQEVRLENYTKALQKIADEAYWVPLFTYNTNYAMSSQLSWQPHPDEIPRFWLASWD
jgi:peptide/nickel transport system substrate-binding protein